MTRLFVAAFAVSLVLMGKARAELPTPPEVTQVRFLQVPSALEPFRRTQQGPELIQKIDPRPFESITTTVAPPEGMLPDDQARELFRADPDHREEVTYKPFHWAAPEIWHRPLYFDDVQLERYGQTWSPLLQPALSGAHFFGILPILPYKTGLDRPLAPVSTLGYYRPGSPAPCVGRRIPWQWDAALIQAGAVVSGVFILP